MCAAAKKLAVAISRNVEKLPDIQYKTNIYSHFNLSKSTPIKITPDMVVSFWYNKGADYTFPSKDEPSSSNMDIWTNAAAGKSLDIKY